MRRSKRATRIAACVLVGVMAMQLSGCGDKKVDYSIDGDSQMSETGDEAGGSEKSALAKKLGVPDSCDLTFDVGKSGLSVISCKDDDIELPDSDRMKKAEFSVFSLGAAQIQTIVEGLLDKSQGIRVRNDGVMTKSELQDLIDQTQGFKEDATSNGDDTIGSWYDTQIETYKKQMADAPDSLPELENYDDPYCEYVGMNGDHKYSLSFSQARDNNTDAGVYISFAPIIDDENIELKKVDGAQYTYLTGASSVDSIDHENIQNNCQINEEAAKDSARNFLSSINVEGMECTKVEPLVRVWSSDDGDELKTEVNGYAVSFSRVISGGDFVMSGLYNVDNLQNSSGYFYDSTDMANVYVNDEGVINMYANIYTDPQSVKEEDVEILSWNDMLEKAQTSIAEYYEKYQTRYGKVEFNNVTLGYMHVMEEDGKTYYIPVWAFKQTEELRDQDSDAEVIQAVLINAMDGSYIDIIENAKSIKLWDSF